MLKNKPYDLCIVGSGVAGALVAATAAKRGLNVIVIEAGKRFDFNKRLEQLKRHRVLGDEVWPWETHGRDDYVDSSKKEIGFHYKLNHARAKALGGSTLHWGGMAQRLVESDFKTASMYGVGIDWPITYEDLEPYYCWSEEELGVSGTPNPLDPPRSKPYPMPAFPMKYGESVWEPVAEKLGLELEIASHARNSEPYKGRSACVAYAVCNVCPSGARYSADFHIQEAEQTSNCTVLTETVARRINTGKEGAVESVTVTGLDGQSREIVAKQFVIAAHAVETTRLLMLSNLANESDQLGRNLMEHWYLTAGGYHSIQTYPYRIGFTTLESQTFYDGHDRDKRGAIKLEFGNSKDPLSQMRKNNLYGEELAEFDSSTFGHWIAVGAELEHQPNSNSRVTLDKRKKDMFGDPVPHIHFAFNDIDLATHDYARNILERIMTAAGTKDVRYGKKFLQADHHIGTCRMSDNPADGVVDTQCKIHGMDNLYIAGSSVFPTSGAKQPTLTIAALSLRLADHLTGKQSK